jgi:uncharacterized Zn-binding protein involved in type VI secretion
MPPAARITDMHVCPMVTGIVPHVGGPILPPGCPTVLIGMLPAARVTDMATCVGPPDIIAMGSPTVLIGNLMAARIGDPTAHGGVIILGCFTVIIGEAGAPSPAAPGGGGVGGALLGAALGALAGLALVGPAGAIIGGVAGGMAGDALTLGSRPLFGQETPMSCGIASTRMVIATITGKTISEATLRTESQSYPGSYTDVDGTRLDNLTDLLRANGVANASTPKSGQSIDDLQRATAGGAPAIAHFRNPGGGGHFVVVDGVRDNSDGSQTIMLRDPWPPGDGTRREMSGADFNSRGFSGWTVTTDP